MCWLTLWSVACCVLADGFRLKCFVLGDFVVCLFVFTMMDGEALTHGFKTHHNKQQHKAL